jgi:hypothetical protein
MPDRERAKAGGFAGLQAAFRQIPLMRYNPRLTVADSIDLQAQRERKFGLGAGRMAKRTTVSRTLRNVQETIGSYIMAPYDGAKAFAKNALSKKTTKKVKKAVRKPIRLGRKAASVSLDQVIETLHEARLVLAQQAAAAGLTKGRKKKKASKKAKTSKRTKAAKKSSQKRSTAARGKAPVKTASKTRGRSAKRKSAKRA